MTKEISQEGLDGKLSSVDDGQLDGVAGGGEVVWKDGMFHAYSVCPACGQKDFYASVAKGGVTFGVSRTCPNCGQQYNDSISVPKNPPEEPEKAACREP